MQYATSFNALHLILAQMPHAPRPRPHTGCQPRAAATDLGSRDQRVAQRAA
jgi:hypothetical protein